MSTRRRTGWHRWANGVNLGAVIVVVFTAAPLYWLITGSLKSSTSLSASPPQAFPAPLTVSNYRDAFVTYTFGRYILNSVVVAVVSTAVVLVLGVLAGYALARLPIRGKFTIMVTLLMISVFPAIAVVSPLYLLEKRLGWMNSYQGLIVPYVAFNLPFAIWILRNYMLGIPKELEESARVDGASLNRTVWSIILPAARPGIFTAGVFTFTATWTEFLMALTFNSENSFRTIPVGIALFGSQFVVPYGTIFAASVVAIAPIAILVLVFRRSVVSGLTAGAVKG